MILVRRWMFLGLILIGMMSCKGIQYVPIKNAQQFQLEKAKNELIKKDQEKVLGRMEWKHRKDTCSTSFEIGHQNFCLQYKGRPDFVVEIWEEDRVKGRIMDIKHHVSRFEVEGEEYLLRPIQGNMVALYQEKSIARIYQKKRKWYLELASEYQQNNLLIAALIYKDWEWQKTNYSSEDMLLWIVLLPVFM